jgi:hypothetical protein
MFMNRVEKIESTVQVEGSFYKELRLNKNNFKDTNSQECYLLCMHSKEIAEGCTPQRWDIN